MKRASTKKMAERPERPDDQQFREFKERVYLQSKKKILDEIDELKNGTNAEYNEKVLYLKRQHDYTLRVNERFHDLELKWIEEEFENTVVRVEKESKEKLDQIEKRMRAELDNYKTELETDHLEKGSAKNSIVLDLDNKNLRQTDKRRRKLFDATADSKLGAKPARKRPRKPAKEQQALRLTKQAEALQTWDCEDDIKAMNKITTASSRGRRPPAKLATGAR
eukprot:m.262309 g.262309  ORF g.262309 m.262309 type:complete len:222 (-) comp45116_c0_seq1:289-954(-)